MIGRTNVGGGGGGNQKVIEGLATAIGVQYPVGWACTCTKGSTTLTAKTTTGLIVFNLPAAGTWTITIKTGSGSSAQTKNTNVTIAENEFKCINLRSLEFLTPANGLISGYTLGGSGASITNNKLVVNVADGSNGSFRFSPAINLSSYTKMTVVCKISHILNMYSEINLGFTASNAAATSASDLSGKVALLTSDDSLDTELTKTVDISSLTGTMYLNSYIYSVQGQITEIILK